MNYIIICTLKAPQINFGGHLFLRRQIAVESTHEVFNIMAKYLTPRTAQEDEEQEGDEYTDKVNDIFNQPG